MHMCAVSRAGAGFSGGEHLCIREKPDVRWHFLAVFNLAPLLYFRLGEAHERDTSPPALWGSDGERSRQAAWGHM